MGIHSVEKKHLSAEGMLKIVRSVFKQVPEPNRDPRGAKPEIALADCLMSGLAIFENKFPSLLQFDQNRSSEPVRHNLKTLYHVSRAPDDTTMRQRLDKVLPRQLRGAFTALFSQLQRGKVLEDYRFLDNYLLIAVDGTTLFSSQKVQCENCCAKHHRNGKTTYYHQALVAEVIHPDQKEVFPLCPEPISKQDGSTKNDCEQNAMQRLLKDFKREHPHIKAVFTADALSAKGPYLRRIQEIGAHFIVNVNPKGNPTLFEWLKGVPLEKKRIKVGGETIDLKLYEWTATKRRK